MSYALFRDLNYDECAELKREKWSEECSKLYRGFLSWRGWESKEDEDIVYANGKTTKKRHSIKSEMQGDVRLILKAENLYQECNAEF